MLRHVNRAAAGHNARAVPVPTEPHDPVTGGAVQHRPMLRQKRAQYGCGVGGDGWQVGSVESDAQPGGGGGGGSA